MGDDRISALPDSLITEILLWLPTRDSVKTSGLSTRWRNLWLDVPGLDIKFLSKSANTITTSFIERFLEFNRDARLRKLKVAYDVSKGHPFGIREWIATAISRGAQHLDVVDTLVDPKELMPLDIYKSKTLVSLKLVEVGLSNPGFVVSLPCLKNMHLETIMYSGEDPSFMEKLISGCPVLEDLTVFRSSYDNVLVLRVRSKSLKRFSVRYKLYLMDRKEFALEIDAPGLKYMSLGDNKSERIVVKNLRSLFMIDIDSIFNVGFEINFGQKKVVIRDFLNGISDVRHMIISQVTLLCVAYLNNVNVEKSESSIVPRCLLSTLECVEIRELITGDETRIKENILKRKKETLMNAARYILENSLVLKKLILVLSPVTNQISDTTKELLTFRKGSRECNIYMGLLHPDKPFLQLIG